MLKVPYKGNQHRFIDLENRVIKVGHVPKPFLFLPRLFMSILVYPEVNDSHILEGTLVKYATIFRQSYVPSYLEIGKSTFWLRFRQLGFCNVEMG